MNPLFELTWAMSTDQWQLTLRRNEETAPAELLSLECAKPLDPRASSSCTGGSAETLSPSLIRTIPPGCKQASSSPRHEKEISSGKGIDAWRL